MGRTGVTDEDSTIHNRVSSISGACVDPVDVIDAAADCVALDDPQAHRSAVLVVDCGEREREDGE